MDVSPNEARAARAAAPLTIRELTTLEAFDAIKGEWNALVRGSATPTLSLTHAWLSEWWRCNRAEHGGMLVLLAYDGGELVGAAPFMRTTRRTLGLPVRTIELLTMAQVAASPSSCSGELDVVLTVRKDDVLAAFFSHLRERHRWDCVRLGPLPESSATLEALERDAAAQRGPLRRQDAFVNFVVPMERGWDAHLESMSKNFRRTLRQHEQKLQKLGAVRCVEYRTPLEIDVMWNDVLEIEKESWKWGKGVAINSAGYREFYRRFALAAAELGWMRLWMIELAGRNIAYDYCVAYGDRVQSLKKSYRNEFRQYFPGGVLDMYAFPAMARDGIREIDLLWGDEEAKRKWAPVTRPHVEALLFNSTAYARFVRGALFGTALSRVAERAESLLKRVLRKLGLAPEWSELTREDQLGRGAALAPRAEPLAPGTAVRVRDRRAILKTLDGAGALGGITCLPEMLGMCGSVYRVASPPTAAFADTAAGGGVVLEGVRCDGREHAGCGERCRLLWREEWLERVSAAPERPSAALDGSGELGRCQTGPETAFGQPRFVGLPKLVRMAQTLEEATAKTVHA